jgi:hypothetical protein
MNGLTSIALVIAFFGVTMAAAFVLTTGTRAVRRVLRRRWQATLLPARRNGRARRGRRRTIRVVRRTRRYW